MKRMSFLFPRGSFDSRLVFLCRMRETESSPKVSGLFCLMGILSVKKGKLHMTP